MIDETTLTEWRMDAAYEIKRVLRNIGMAPADMSEPRVLALIDELRATRAQLAEAERRLAGAREYIARDVFDTDNETLSWWDAQADYKSQWYAIANRLIDDWSTPTPGAPRE